MARGAAILLALLFLAVLASAARAAAVPGTFTGQTADHCQYSWTVNGTSFNGSVDCPQGVGTDLNFRSSGSAAGTTAKVTAVTILTGGASDLINDTHAITVNVSADDPATASKFWSEFTTAEIAQARKLSGGENQSDVVAKWIQQTTFSDISKQYKAHCDQDAQKPAGERDPLCTRPAKNKAGEQTDETCPIYGKDSEKDTQHICIPTAIAGEWNPSKDNVRIEPPYGAVLVLDPQITVKKQLMIVFGGMFGTGASLKAKELEVEGGLVAIAGALRVTASKVSLNYTVSYVGRLTAAVSDKLTLGSRASLSLNGGGWPAGPNDPPGAAARGGSRNGWGGSYGGLGGMPDEGRSQYAHYANPGGPGASHGDPFDPTDPGYGGASQNAVYANNTAGSPGGGVLRIAGDKVTIDGKITANGEDGVLAGGFVKPAGGAGSGGAISIRATELGGTGKLQADGGAPCSVSSYGIAFPAKEGGCQAAFGGTWGGGGGGGRIALRYVKLTSWKASMEARPRRDDHTIGEGARPGGAGTIFKLQRTPKQMQGEVKGFGLKPDDMSRLKKLAKQKKAPNDGSPRHGTLIVDGGWTATNSGHYRWPPLGWTPVLDTWSSSERDLVLQSGAIVLAHRLRFHRIEVTGASEITSGLINVPPVNRWCSKNCGGGQRLELFANSISVDASSRIDVSGVGGAGGELQSTAPNPTSSVAGSSAGWGGSHGGRGGRCQDTHCPGQAGRTYDSRVLPDQPGAGAGGWPGARDPWEVGASGGGVVLIDAGTFKLNGRLASDGFGDTVPTKSQPFYRMMLIGGGAGGAVRIRADDFTGEGVVSADGGDSCEARQSLLALAWVQPCESAATAAGSGGGGRIALRYGSLKEWHGKLTAAGGRDAEGEANQKLYGGDFRANRGAPGTIFRLHVAG